MATKSQKKQMQERIAFLERKCEKLYEAGADGIGYVGAANYHSREVAARANLDAVFYEDAESDITKHDSEDDSQ